MWPAFRTDIMLSPFLDDQAHLKIATYTGVSRYEFFLKKFLLAEVDESSWTGGGADGGSEGEEKRKGGGNVYIGR